MRERRYFLVKFSEYRVYKIKINSIFIERFQTPESFMSLYDFNINMKKIFYVNIRKLFYNFKKT